MNSDLKNISKSGFPCQTYRPRLTRQVHLHVGIYDKLITIRMHSYNIQCLYARIVYYAGSVKSSFGFLIEINGKSQSYFLHILQNFILSLHSSFRATFYIFNDKWRYKDYKVHFTCFRLICPSVKNKQAKKRVSISLFLYNLHNIFIPVLYWMQCVH